MDKREGLRRLVDSLPEESLEQAERALRYCTDPNEPRFTIQQAQERVRAKSLRQLSRHAETTGTGYISSIGSGGHSIKPDGDFRSSMDAWEDGLPVTYHLVRFSGHSFELFERLFFDGERNALVLSYRIVGPNGNEQTLGATIPVR